MERARRHQRLLARFALRPCSRSSPSWRAAVSLTGSTSAVTSRRPYAGAEYYPELVAVVKVAVALMLARLAWRFAKARAVARGARRLLIAQGSPVARHPPRVRLQLSPRLWLGSFLVTSLIYLVQIDAEGNLGRIAGRCSRPGCIPPRCRSSQCCRSSWRSCTAPSRAGSPTTRATRRETVARASRLSAETLPFRARVSASSSRRAASSGSRSKSGRLRAPA